MKDTSATPVGVLGAGNWGTTLAILGAKNRPVFLYDRHRERAQEMQTLRENKRYLPGTKIPQNVEIVSDLKVIFDRCPLIVPVIPSSQFRTFMREAAQHVRGDHFFVHGTKGLEPVVYKRMSEVIVEETGCLRVGAISGPNLATELARGQPAATVVASRFEEVIRTTQEVFNSSTFRVYGNHDLVGVEWAGALKNIIAIGAGILSAFEYGQNALAMLITRGVTEMSRLVTLVGGEHMTLLGLAGVGDILATSTSPLSRNYRAGVMLAKGVPPQEIEKKLEMTVEGLHTVKVAYELSRSKKMDSPITAALHEVIYNQKPATHAMQFLMERPVQFEA